MDRDRGGRAQGNGMAALEVPAGQQREMDLPDGARLRVNHRERAQIEHSPRGARSPPVVVQAQMQGSPPNAADRYEVSH